MSNVTVAQLVGALESRFPLQRAEGWDRIGLVAGDPDSVVTGVVCALDPTLDAIHNTVAAGCNVLVTHHPVALSALGPLRPGSGPEAIVYAAVSQGVALLNAHTNLDRDGRAQRLLPERLELLPVRPLESAPMPMSVVTAYVPSAAITPVTDAMAAAGAGRVGDYTGCNFSATGTGSFIPAPDSIPYAGQAGVRSIAEELRVEMVCARGLVAEVISAAIRVHPYEEPLVTAVDVVISRNSAALGMICELPGQESISLRELAQRCAREFGVTVRAWGDADATLTRVATATGSAGSLIGAAKRAGIGALVAGEVRYHDALDAASSGLGIIELGHDVSEWPLVALLAEAVLDVNGIDPESVHTLSATPGWWSAGAGAGQ